MKCLILIACVALLAAGCDRATVPSLPTSPTPSTTSSPPRQPEGPYYVPGTGTMIVPGQVVVGTIVSGPACFWNWEANGVCQVFEIAAPQDGTLEATVTRKTESAIDIMDLFLVEPNGAWVAAHAGRIEEHATIPVKGGMTYGILVMSFNNGPLEFELKADFRPR
jgi:hypothetical protein